MEAYGKEDKGKYELDAFSSEKNACKSKQYYLAAE